LFMVTNGPALRGHNFILDYIANPIKCLHFITTGLNALIFCKLHGTSVGHGD